MNKYKNRRFLYSVWRNEDDSLVILDGTAVECAKAMGVTKNTFYILASDGGNAKWTIKKNSLKKILQQTKM